MAILGDGGKGFFCRSNDQRSIWSPNVISSSRAAMTREAIEAGNTSALSEANALFFFWAAIPMSSVILIEFACERRFRPLHLAIERCLFNPVE